MDFQELHDFIKNNQPNICQVSVHKMGKEIYADEWNNYKKDDTCHVMSVTKSVVSLLIGIAIDKGYIKSLDDFVLDYFPEYKIKKGEKTIQKVTLRLLMSMQAPYKYKYEPWVKICTQDDWTRAALDFLGGRKGLTEEFKYSTLGIHILTGIISKTSGMKVVDFANKYLFEPIGVKKHINYLAKSAEEHKEFTISKEPKTDVWFCDQQGVGTAGYGLCFSASDLAKIGDLCLNKGKFNGQIIISSSWFDEMIKVTHVCGKEFGYMKYASLWWVLNEEKGIYAALGNSGNVIYIYPAENLAIAVASYFKPTIFDRVNFIEKYLLPYVSKM